MRKTGRTFANKGVIKRKDYIGVMKDRLIESGRKKVYTKEQLEEYPIGSPISYITTTGIYRQAGFIYRFEDDCFIYKKPEFGKYSYRVRYDIVKKMYVGNVNEVVNDLVSFVPVEQKKTNYPVTVNGCVIYYAKDSYDRARFMKTERYNIYVKWCKYFLKDDI